MTQPTKKLLNTVENCVDDNLLGFVNSHVGLRLIPKHRLVVRADIETLRAKGQVTILSGGGAGHEPFAAGYVGRGMLTGAVSGAVFTSPTSASILAAIRLLASRNRGGTLLLVLNYTGDRLTFGQAIERARLEGLKVEMVIIGEDCALSVVNKAVGRRGLCGSLFLFKLAGSLAEANEPLQKIVAIVSEAATKMGTIGVCLSPCSLPGSGSLFQLGQDEVEIGLGIHGESGVKRIKIRSASGMVETMMSHMTNPDSACRFSLKAGDEIAIIVNNLGGLSQMEMNVMISELLSYLKTAFKVFVLRCYVGTFQTSLDMVGLSFGFLTVDEPTLAYLDDITTAPSWLQAGKGLLSAQSQILIEPLIDQYVPVAQKPSVKVLGDADLITKCILSVCDAIELNEAKLNALDSGCGDGDCGTTFKTGAMTIRDLINDGLQCVNLKETFLTIADAISDTVGGCSGALSSIFFTAAAGTVTVPSSPLNWCCVLENGTKAIMHYGRAEPGDRTMIDPLCAAQNMLRAQLEVGSRPVAALAEAVDEAREACKQTADMKAKAGRASYVSVELLNQPDAGATAVVIILESILETIKSEPY